MKYSLILLLMLGLGATAVLIGLACSANPTGPSFQAPLQTVQQGNPTLTFTPTPSFTPTTTSTGTPTITNTPNPYVTVSWNTAFGGVTFNQPSALAVQNSPSIYLYVADKGNNRVEKFTNTGSLVTSWGAGGRGKGTINFNTPLALAVTVTSSGSATLFVAGPTGIGVFDTNGNYLTTYTGFNNPQGLALDGSGNLYVSDTGNLRIVELSANSDTPITSFGGTGAVTLSQGVTGTGLALWGSQTTLFVSEQTTLNIPNTYDSVALYNTASGSVTGSITGFLLPTGLAVDNQGNLYVADAGNKSIEVFSPGANSPAITFNNNNTLSNPVAVAVDSNGEIYVADSANNAVYNFAP